MSDLHTFFVTCPSGLESLLKQELMDLGLVNTRETVTGVLCEGKKQDAYTICLWSRLANRVLLLLAEEKSGNAHQIQAASRNVPWEQHICESDSIRVDFNGRSDAIRHSQYGAQLIKDGVVDRFVEQGKARPNVDLSTPDHRINVRLSKRKLYISLDLSGESLHKRGYRDGQGLAPIKENLAAALLVRAKWPKFAAEGRAFIDPMCGSGTFLIEAVMMGANIAPGILRKDFGFFRWKQFDENQWLEVKNQAELARSAGLKSFSSSVTGCEIAPEVATQARNNIRKAGLCDWAQVLTGEFKQISTVQHSSDAGLILCNPPYGMRLGEEDKLPYDYFQLASLSKRYFPGWTLGILSSSAELLAETRLRADKKYRIFNGPIACELRLFHVREAGSLEHGERRESLSDGAQMLVNRFEKNQKKLKAWLQRENITCYRIYDADLPEYAAAIDVYGDYLHIQEYQAPKNIDTDKAAKRFKEIVSAVKHFFQADDEHVHTKVRKKNKGKEQYQKQAQLEQSDFICVSEGKAQLLVNLKSYLDTGLFLDHRPLRSQIEKLAAGKRFLNLFSYTSSATVRAVLGGASSSTSVDMSNTYTQWSRLNFEKNNIRSDKHQIVREDVMVWLKNCRSGYDLIMLDPPSFSNSKRMDNSFDVQRDHTYLVRRCMELLNKGGTLFFSNNYRKFQLDESLRGTYAVEDISAATIDKDFERNQKIHTCFKIEHKPI